MAAGGRRLSGDSNERCAAERPVMAVRPLSGGAGGPAGATKAFPCIVPYPAGYPRYPAPPL
jgi:hypothetical protein